MSTAPGTADLSVERRRTLPDTSVPAQPGKGETPGTPDLRPRAQEHPRRSPGATMYLPTVIAQLGVPEVTLEDARGFAVATMLFMALWMAGKIRADREVNREREVCQREREIADLRTEENAELRKGLDTLIENTGVGNDMLRELRDEARRSG